MARASWWVKLLAKFESQYGWLERSWPMTRDLTPASGFITSMSIYHHYSCLCCCFFGYFNTLSIEKDTCRGMDCHRLCTYTVNLCLAVRSYTAVSCQKSQRLLNCQNPGIVLFCGHSCPGAPACLLPFPAIISSADLIFSTEKTPSWIFAHCFSPCFPCSSPLRAEVSSSPEAYYCCCGSSFEGLSQLSWTLLARKQMKTIAEDHPGYKVLHFLHTGVPRSQG